MKQKQPVSKLTKSQLETLKYLARGYTQRQVSVLTNKHYQSVKRQMERARIKTGAPTTNRLISLFVDEFGLPPNCEQSEVLSE